MVVAVSGTADVVVVVSGISGFSSETSVVVVVVSRIAVVVVAVSGTAVVVVVGAAGGCACGTALAVTVGGGVAVVVVGVPWAAVAGDAAGRASSGVLFSPFEEQLAAAIARAATARTSFLCLIAGNPLSEMTDPTFQHKNIEPIPELRRWAVAILYNPVKVSGCAADEHSVCFSACGFL